MQSQKNCYYISQTIKKLSNKVQENCQSYETIEGRNFQKSLPNKTQKIPTAIVVENISPTAKVMF